jgi:hypothetical protein
MIGRTAFAISGLAVCAAGVVLALVARSYLPGDLRPYVARTLWVLVIMSSAVMLIGMVRGAGRNRGSR